jgi:site-specific DNA-methyltransferase (adenine-specific)
MLDVNKIYLMNCFEFLDKIDDCSIDLVVVDPPYNMKKAEWDTFGSQQEFLDFSYRWIDKVVEKLSENGSLYIFNTPFNSAFFCQHLSQKNLHFQNWITWDKRDGMGGAKRRYSTGQETILFFTKSKKHTFNYDDVRVPYESTERIKHAAEKGILKNGKRWFPNPDGRLCGEVWHFSSQRHKQKINGKVQKLEHITPKPHDLLERIIKASSNEGDLVLDCFMGSGSTAIVAKKLGRDFIGCDEESKYVDLANTTLDLIVKGSSND